MNRAGVNVVDTVIEQLAASEAVLTPDEKDLGVALVDIGGGTADVAIFERGSLWHTAVIAVGGDHFTNDLMIGLNTARADAEMIKETFGAVTAGWRHTGTTFEVPELGKPTSRLIEQRLLRVERVVRRRDRGDELQRGRLPDRRAPDSAPPSDESGTERDFHLEIKMLSIFRRIMKNEQGATAIEYTLIASLIAVAAITAMSTVGGKVTNVLTNVGNAMT